LKIFNISGNVLLRGRRNFAYLFNKKIMSEQPSREGLQPKGEKTLKKFSTDISGCNIVPTEGKWKGVELSPSWRTFDTFDQRTSVSTLDGKTQIPVAELEGVEVEIIPHDEE
jgi:hypothetical protein